MRPMRLACQRLAQSLDTGFSVTVVCEPFEMLACKQAQTRTWQGAGGVQVTGRARGGTGVRSQGVKRLSVTLNELETR